MLFPDPIILALFASSLAVGAWIVFRLGNRQAVVPYSARRHVPWTVLEVAVAIVMYVLLVDAVRQGVPRLCGFELPDAVDKLTPRMLASLLVGNEVAKLSAVGMAVALAWRRCGATASDLGLSSRYMASDVRLGGLAFLASLVPVYAVRLALTEFYRPEESLHPIMQMLQKERSLAILATAGFSAVVSAPLAEELLFRVLLQGWFESKLDRGRRSQAATLGSANDSPIDTSYATPSPPTPSEAFAESQSPNPDAPPDNIDVGIGAASSIADADAESVRERRIAGGIAIALSSLVFAAFHAANWPDPVPLVVLAAILGYLYHRTGRLLPGLVTHVMFNALSIGIAWITQGAN